MRRPRGGRAGAEEGCVLTGEGRGWAEKRQAGEFLPFFLDPLDDSEQTFPLSFPLKALLKA